MTSSTVVNEVIATELDLTFDLKRRYSAHPHETHWDRRAFYVVTFLDVVCARRLSHYDCEQHVGGSVDAAEFGRWCVCTIHAGHRGIDIQVLSL